MRRSKAAPPWATLLVTLAAIGIASALTFAVPTPLPIKGALYAIPLSAAVYASYSGRAVPAIVSATLASAYSFAHYDALDAIFPHRRDRIMLAFAVVLVTYGMTFAGLRMRRRHDDLAERAIQAEHAHSEKMSAKNAELERANAALMQANRALEAFTYVVSHDLKEPARALGAFARSLQEEHAHALDDDGKELVSRSVATSRRLELLLNGLLDYSRATQIQPHELEDLRIEDVLREGECLSRYEGVLRERAGRLDVRPGPAVRASLTGLCQVVGNLVLNSLKHNPRPDVQVTIATAPDPDDPRMVDVTIEDNGPGYQDALIDQFNRATRGRPTTLRGGFGLIIAREAAEKMGGSMRLAKAASGGARTIITLPAATGAK